MIICFDPCPGNKYKYDIGHFYFVTFSNLSTLWSSLVFVCRSSDLLGIVLAPILTPLGSHFDLLGAPFGYLLALFGSLAAPLGFSWLPFGALLISFGSRLAPDGSPVVPFGSLVAPFGCLLAHWLPLGSVRILWLGCVA